MGAELARIQGMIDVVSLLALAVSSIFVSVLLSGALSGVITLGLIELFWRQVLQRSLLSGIFVPFHSSDLRSDLFSDFIRTKYAARNGSAGSTQEGTKAAIEDYARTLLEICDGPDVFPHLLGIRTKTFYRLHYRQLFGQIMAGVSSESILAAEQPGFTPVIDTLVYMSLSRESVANEAPSYVPKFYPIGPSLEPRAADPSAAQSNHFSEKLRLDMDQATREIDQLQAEVSERISRFAFGCSFVIWWFALFLIAAAAGRNQHFQLPPDGVFLSLVFWATSNVVNIVFAVILSLPLAFASAVVASLVFAWLDRGFSSK